MSGLRRTQSGIFTLENAVDVDTLTEENIASAVIPTQDVLPFDTLVLTSSKAYKIFDGVAIETDAKDGLYKFYKEESFYGIAEVRSGKAKIKTKLC